MAKILSFAGSSRENSLNKMLVKIAAAGAREAGALVTEIDLTDYPMPIFNQDLEDKEGMPENASKFKRHLIDHDGFLIASPEYNSAFSALLKNSIDWASRTESGEPPLIAYKGKMAVIMAASPSVLGGLRGLVSLRMLLANLGVTVLPEQQTIPHADRAFNADGSLIKGRKQELVLTLGRKLAIAVAKQIGSVVV